MNFKCSCGFVFEGRLESCPSCGKKFKWPEETKKPDLDRNKNKEKTEAPKTGASKKELSEIKNDYVPPKTKGENELKQLLLIRALYTCNQINEKLANLYGREHAIRLCDLSNSQSRSAEREVVRKDYYVPYLDEPDIPIVAPIIITLVAAAGLSAVVGFLGAIFNFGIEGYIWGIIVGSIIGLGLLISLIMVFVFIGSKIHNKRVYKRECARAIEINKQIDKEYEENLKSFKKRKAEEVKVCKEASDKSLVVMNKYRKYAEISKDAYEKVLSTSVVHRKYHDIVPICQFIEYLDTKRCYQLEGSNGCYNKYEEELRQNMIISRLDNIESKLDQIANNQQTIVNTLRSIDIGVRSMYDEICQLNDKTDDIKENLIAIKTCQEISNGINAEIAANSASIAWNLNYLTNRLK